MDIAKKHKNEERIRDVVREELYDNGFFHLRDMFKPIIEETVRRMLDEGKIRLRPNTRIYTSTNNIIEHAETSIDIEISDNSSYSTRRFIG